jgi:hypothetical protein
MRYLITVVIAALSLNAFGQMPVEFPWNPDQDGDDFIGLNDLMGLLSVYGLEFAEEGLYVTDDQQGAIYITGTGMVRYSSCQKQCNDLPGNWWIPRIFDIKEFENDLITDLAGFDNTSQKIWLHHESTKNTYPYQGQIAGIVLSPLNGNIGYGDLGSSNEHCACFTKERPKLDIEYINLVINHGSDGLSQFNSMCDVKLIEGFYPMGPVQVVAQCGQCPHSYTQAFWRWAE